MAKTDKATAGKRASALTNLKRKVKERDEKYKTYVEMLETAFSNSKSGKSIPKQLDKGDFKKIHKEIKKLEDEIQGNIKRSYAEKKESYDEYFKESGKPVRYLPPKKQIISNKGELEAMKKPKQYTFPNVEGMKTESAKPSGESGEGVDFGNKQGKAKKLTETTAVERKPKTTQKPTAKPTAAEEAQLTVANKDVKLSSEMPEFLVTRTKDILNYMEQFSPQEHEVLIERRDQLIANNPQYMDLTKEERDRLNIYYTKAAFEKFDLQFRNDIMSQADAASKIGDVTAGTVEDKGKGKAEDKSISKTVGDAMSSMAKAIAEEPDLDTEPEERRRGKTADQPQREGDEHKIKSGDSNNKANAEPATATSGAEKNEAKSAPTQPPAATTTAAPTSTTVETTDSGTKFDGMEGEVEIAYTGGGVGGSGVGAFKGDILSQLEPQSEVASKLAEDKKRRRKDVERLIKEINCYHLVYNDDIPLFRSKEHNKAKEEAIASKDRDKLIKHHMMMSNAIRQYYKTADLRVGVIMSAESMFGQSVSNLITGHMASGGAALPNALGGNKFVRTPLGAGSFRPKGSDPVKGAIAGNVNITRGGRNTKRPVARLVPKVGLTPDAVPLPEIEPVVDAPYPYVFRTGVRARRQYRNPELKLKVKK